ncbi:TM0106 family RecB-like putative nuclease [Enemella dayhoffiae]|uniref:TM0106 family RecB-like putative nuclease n=1 Tax=Enemella dayhoffiae TaxID=2016507 RepID=UPI0011401913|nr:TM0106 family RecB-like putative nuclease [Enemella dayhoffiae]
MGEPVRPGAAVLLDAWAAQTCAVKTWYAHAPAVPDQPATDESLREAFNGGASFSDLVLDEVVRVGPGDLVDLRPLAGAGVAEWAEASRAALGSGAPLIIGALLPVDVSGHRSGRPHLLVRGEDATPDRPGYHPVLVTRRRVCEPNRAGRPTARVSGFGDPAYASALDLEDRTLKLGRDGPLIQLGHYWRMLQAAGHAAGSAPEAGLIGTDAYPLGTDPQTGEPGVCWVPLDQPLVRTFSRSSETGWRLRTVLERQDHEHAFRVKVAENARAGGEAIVQPVRNRECDHCVWWQHCRPLLGADDISVRIDRTPLDVREIGVLRSLGIRTVTELAAAELAEVLPRYLPEVRHREGAESRIRNAHRRAGLMVAGVDLEKITSGPIEVPTAPVEIDLDIETSAEDHVYLWGFLVHDRRTEGPPRFVEFSAWRELDADGEVELAARAMRWLRDLEAEVGQVRVFHYSPYEVNRLQLLAERSDDPELQWALGNSAEWCDLFTIVRDHYFGTRGLGLKVVASLGAGFRWRDEDPGGLNSQSWYAEACLGATEEARAAARQRVLDYNEDDVRATWHLRQWLRTHTG